MSVLWTMVALAALTMVAVVTSITDLALVGSHRDHAAALGLAEAALADVLDRLRVDPGAGSRRDSLAGVLETGAYRAEWEPSGAGVRVRAIGDSYGLRREIEAWVVAEPMGGRRVYAWREVR